MRRSQRGDSIWPVVLLLFALALVGFMEWRNAPVEQAVRARPVVSELRVCDLTISDGKHYGNMPSPRCYFSPERIKQ